jgi:hypothetical protein
VVSSEEFQDRLGRLGARKDRMVRERPSNIAPAALAGRMPPSQRLLVSPAVLLLRAAEAERACGRVSSARSRSVLRRQVFG